MAKIVKEEDVILANKKIEKIEMQVLILLILMDFLRILMFGDQNC